MINSIKQVLISLCVLEISDTTSESIVPPLMAKMTRIREDHCHIILVSRGNNFFIPQ